MRPRDRRGAAVAAAAAAAVATLGAAGAVSFGRRHFAVAHEAAAERAVGLGVEVAAARERQLAAPAPEAPPWSLLASPDVSGTMAIVQQLADDAGVALHGVKAAPAAPGKQSFAIGGRGVPAAVCELVAALEQHRRLLVVESGRLAPADGGDVSFELGIATAHAGGER